eukprot:2727933-Rhodomonas_salina.2
MLDGILERKRKEVEELKANPPEGATALLEGKKIKGGKFAKCALPLPLFSVENLFRLCFSDYLFDHAPGHVPHV